MSDRTMRMSKLLTIPLETRVRIINYAVSDLYVSTWWIKRVDMDYGTSAGNPDSSVWKGDDWLGGWTYLKNPNVNIPLICRQVRDECKPPHVRKPTLANRNDFIHNYEWDDFWYFLRQEELDVAKMLRQISSLTMYDSMSDNEFSLWLDDEEDGSEKREDQQAIDNLKEAFKTYPAYSRHIGDDYDIEITVVQDFIVEFTTTVKPR